MSGSRRQVPNDPDRRSRILEAALDVIAEVGVHKTTHRRIAARAEVPLGSLTYYFASLEDILEQAFESLSVEMSARYRRSLEEAAGPAEAEAAVVDLICGAEYAVPREMILLFEMYAYGNHNAAVAELARTWLLRSRDSLTIHFSPDVARALDALVEGWPMHRTFEHRPLDRSLVAATVHAVVVGLQAREG